MSQPPDAAPDWGAVSGDIACPLCGYNLRGLTEARCPECGYRFAWADLLYADKRRHPYLFEEHPKRNVWSFLRTLLGGLLPQSFWASLKPSHRPVPRRLAIYWALTPSLLLFGWAAFSGGTLLLAEQSVRAERAEHLQYAMASFPPASPNSDAAARSRWMASLQKSAEAQFPSVLTVDGARQLLFDGEPTTFTRLALLCLIWPVATLATLMIFKQSMRKAKVGAVHVFRCVVYGCDFGIWLGLLAVPCLPDNVKLTYGLGGPTAILMIAATAVALVACYRLTSAYRLYLKFDHPLATVVASQLIVLLLAFIVALDLRAWR